MKSCPAPHAARKKPTAADGPPGASPPSSAPDATIPRREGLTEALTAPSPGRRASRAAASPRELLQETPCFNYNVHL